MVPLFLKVFLLSSKMFSASDEYAALLDAPGNFFSRAQINFDDQAQLLIAVRQDGALLRFAPEGLRENDRAVVLAAVQTTGTAIQFTGRDFKADKELAEAAVEQDWRALKHISRLLQRDEDIVHSAVTRGAAAQPSPWRIAP